MSGETHVRFCESRRGGTPSGHSAHSEFLEDARLASGVRVLLTVVILGVFLLMVQATPVLASKARLFTGSFGAAGSTLANPYPLSPSTYGVAVDDATHDVYVTDGENHRVEKFGPAGEFILMFGKEVNLTKVLSAAPESEQNVCTAASFDACQAGSSTVSPGGFEFPVAVAVDNSAGESRGDVYVADAWQRLVSKFDSAGGLVSGWGSKGQLDGSTATGSVKGPFGEFGSVAVDPSGNLWVLSTAGTFEFRDNSAFVTAGYEHRGHGSIAVDSEGNLYLAESIDEVVKVNSSGSKIGVVRQNREFTVIWGLTVDPTANELYVGAENSESVSRVERYDSSCHPTDVGHCTPVESFGSAHLYGSAGLDYPSGLTVDPSTSADRLYVAERSPSVLSGASEVAVFSVETVPDVSTLKATGFASGSATLNGSVDPSGVELKAGLEGCRFEWGETEAYGHVAACDKSAVEIGSGSSPVEVSASITGLQQGKTYHFRLVAGNANDVNSVTDEPSLGVDLAFGPPEIESESAVAVAGNGATVQAQVNPNNVDTRVRVEYGTDAGVYGHSTPETGLGADGTGELVPFQLSGLVPGTAYHYRVVAENALGEGAEAVAGPDRVFVTQPAAAGFALADGRGWELVSPPDKHGAQLRQITDIGVVQASVTGDAISYLASGSTEDEPAGVDEEMQVLSRRAVGGWESEDIATPHESATGVSVGSGSEYRFFSSDLSLGIVQPFGVLDPGVSIEASEQTAFLRTNFPNGNVDSPCRSSCYRPLVTGAPGYANVSSETVFAPKCGDKGVEKNLCGPQFLGASPDLSHVMLWSGSALIEGVPSSSLYEWSGGGLTLVSILPNNQPISISQYSLGEAAVARNAVSIDGSRIVWSDTKENLYVRDSVREETVQVGSGPVRFQTASSDGSKILFTTEEREARNQYHADLQECVIVESEDKLHCEIVDLTPVGAGEDPGVLGLIPGASSDLSYVYFVSDGVLKNNGVPVSGARQGGCGNATVGVSATCNLYVRHDGTTKLVAELSGEDGPDWSDLAGLVGRVSPNGRWFEFMSNRSLTGYDNRDSVTGKPDEEVYLYDASANGGEGHVICASCDPTRARPHGMQYTRLESGHGGLSGDVLDGFAEDQGIAAIVPGWIRFALGHILYQPRYLSDSGRLFFNSSDALVPEDSNGTVDVYEYEPVGVGDCATSSVTFGQASDGCAGLISSGTSKEESAFLDASENGSDVFFLSYAQLSHRDTDSIRDVYDARVDGGFPEPSAPPVCEGDACQSPVGAPEDQTPGSLTYSGPGNPGTLSSVTVVGKHKAKKSSRAGKLANALAACRRVRSKRVRGECVSRARRRFGSARAGGAKTMKGRR